MIWLAVIIEAGIENFLDTVLGAPCIALNVS
jgi:hypothetical protein